MDYPIWQQAAVLVMVFAVFFVAVIRPPRMAEARRFRAVMASSPGDIVLTAAGIYGRIAEAGTVDTPFLVEIADGVIVRVDQRGIAEVLTVPASDAAAPAAGVQPAA